MPPMDKTLQRIYRFVQVVLLSGEVRLYIKKTRIMGKQQRGTDEYQETGRSSIENSGLVVKMKIIRSIS